MVKNLVTCTLKVYWCRLVKGGGEIIEEIVSKERQKAINKVGKDLYLECIYLVPLSFMQQATVGDGMSFQQGLRKLL